MDDLLQQGITAYKAGKRDEARKIFITFGKQSPDNELAWGWMYQVSNNDQERTYCLKQILRINPKSEKAKQLLDTLTGNDFPFELSQKIEMPAQEQSKKSVSPEIQNKIPGSSQKKSNSSQQNNTNNLTSQIVWGILIAVGIIVGISLLIFILPLVFGPQIGDVFAFSCEPGDNNMYYCNFQGSSDIKQLESIVRDYCDKSQVQQCEVHVWAGASLPTLPMTDSQLSTRIAQYKKNSGTGYECFITFQNGEIKYQSSGCSK